MAASTVYFIAASTSAHLQEKKIQQENGQCVHVLNAH